MISIGLTKLLGPGMSDNEYIINSDVLKQITSEAINQYRTKIEEDKED